MWAATIKTKDGWLLIYQAVCRRDESRYKMGAMLLDLKDPTKVLARSRNPILEPIAPYENEGWKAGVVYPCGAVVINNRLFVYYGGADMVVCVASAKLNNFVEQLSTNHKETKPESIPVRPPTDKKIMEPVQGYCLRCKQMQPIRNPRHVVLKNMRHAIQGVCSWCGAKISRLVKSKPDTDDE